jgi:hypothetical protein
MFSKLDILPILLGLSSVAMGSVIPEESKVVDLAERSNSATLTWFDPGD